VLYDNVIAIRCSTLPKKDIEKITFRKLQDAVSIRHVGFRRRGTNIAANKVSTRNEAANDINIPSFSSHL